MISTSFRVALSALFFAGALGLASTGVAQAKSVMKAVRRRVESRQGQQHDQRHDVAGVPEAVPHPEGEFRGARRRACRGSCRRAGSGSRAGANLPAEARPRANGGSRDRGRPIHHRGGSAGAVPVRQSGLAQHQVPHLSLRGHAQLRHDQAGRLYVRSRRQRRGRSRLQEPNWSAEAAAVSRRGSRARPCPKRAPRGARAWASKRRGRAKARRALATRSESRRQTGVVENCLWIALGGRRPWMFRQAPRPLLAFPDTCG